MARRPEDLESYPLTVDTFDDDSEQNLPPYSRDARDYEPFKHPNLTGYRALVLTLTFAFGIPKAILMYKNKSQSGSGVATSLDLVFGVACVTTLYWVGLYEESHPPWMRRWLFNSNESAIQRNTEEWHHPRLTGYRIIILVLTVIFGIWKAALMYMGQNIAPNMLDWEFGVVCITGLFWLGWYERNHPPWMGWIFAENSAASWYDHANKWEHPQLTGYRMLVIMVTSSFGMSKAVLALKGKSVAATSLDLVLGVFWTSTLYWLGLYQNNCPASWRWFFMDGYFGRLSAATLAVFSALSATLLLIVTALISLVPVILPTYAIAYFYLESSQRLPGPLNIFLGFLIFYAFLMILLMGCMVVMGFFGALFGLFWGIAFIVSFVKPHFQRLGVVASRVGLENDLA